MNIQQVYEEERRRLKRGLERSSRKRFKKRITDLEIDRWASRERLHNARI